MPTKPKFEPRKLMELAIGAMLQSVHEPRDDSKASPMVGAALWKPGGTVETAFVELWRFSSETSDLAWHPGGVVRKTVDSRNGVGLPAVPDVVWVSEESDKEDYHRRPDHGSHETES